MFTNNFAHENGSGLYTCNEECNVLNPNKSEQLEAQVRRNDQRVLLLSISTAHTRSDCSRNFILPTLSRIGWVKVGGEGGYTGLRGTYAKSIPVLNGIEFGARILQEREAARLAIEGGIADYALPDKDAEFHLMISECLFYGDALQGLLQLPLQIVGSHNLLTQLPTNLPEREKNHPKFKMFYQEGILDLSEDNKPIKEQEYMYFKRIKKVIFGSNIQEINPHAFYACQKIFKKFILKGHVLHVFPNGVLQEIH